MADFDRRLRRLARLVGQVRDRDVAVELLTGVDDAVDGPTEREALERHRSRLRDDARTGRELLRAFLRSESDARLLPELSTLLAAPLRPGAARELRRVLGEHRTAHGERVVTAHRRARRRPSMERLHRLRIRVRRMRQFADLIDAVDPGAPGLATGQARRVQVDLGRLHDLDVLLEGIDPGLRDASWVRALRRERRRERRSVVRDLKGMRPRRAGLVRAVPPSEDVPGHR